MKRLFTRRPQPNQSTAIWPAPSHWVEPEHPALRSASALQNDDHIRRRHMRDVGIL